MSSLELAFWQYLPTVLTAITYASALVAVVCFVFCWRRSGRKGFALLAVAIGLPLAAGVILPILSRSGRTAPRHGAAGIPVVRRNVRFDLPVIGVLTAWGAILLFRDEKKRTGHSAGDATD